MPTIFNIPRQSDRELFNALIRTADRMRQCLQLRPYVQTPRGSKVELVPEYENQTILAVILEINSCTCPTLFLDDPVTGNTALNLSRNLALGFDSITIEDTWTNRLEVPQKVSAFVRLLGYAREEFKAADLDAALIGQSDSPWSRLLSSQAIVLNSLQQTSEELLVKSAREKIRLDEERESRFKKLELELRNELAKKREDLDAEIEKRNADLAQREQQLAKERAEFKTKEAAYVSREERDAQIRDLKASLTDWSLTSGTRKKRWPVFWGYVGTLILTAILTAVATYSNFVFMDNAKDFDKIQWWHWVLMTLKTLLPFAAFTTSMVYFIRWEAAWARQHAEEEFLNRTRLLDIGRSSWLLEAVRDSHEKGKDIPPILLAELSRNLFAMPGKDDRDIHPTGMGDVLMQGLSSFRLKTPDGSELEAKREDKQKAK